MYIEENEFHDLVGTLDCHQDDVAQFIDVCGTLEELVSELKSYFKLNDEYYKEREYWRNVVKKSAEETNV